MSREMVVSSGPANEFQEILLFEMLAEAHIPSRFMCLSDLPPDSWPCLTKAPEYEVFGVAVPEQHYAKTLEIVKHAMNRCTICLCCGGFFKPGENICCRCGAAADPRDPDQIRAAYYADCQKHQQSTD